MDEVKKPFKISDLSAIELSDLDSRDLLLISDFDASDGKSSKKMNMATLSTFMKNAISSELLEKITKLEEFYIFLSRKMPRLQRGI